MRIRYGIVLVVVAVVVAGCEGDFTVATDPTVPTASTATSPDATLEALADSCVGGEMAACDELWSLAPVGSEFERLGASCGGPRELGDEAPFGNCVVGGGTTTTSTLAAVTTSMAPQSELLQNPRNNTWTVILRSVAEDESADAAIAYAMELRGIDLIASVFLSSGYPSLNPGYWVVYAGEYEDPDSAAAVCGQLQQRGIECYHRFVGDEAR